MAKRCILIVLFCFLCNMSVFAIPGWPAAQIIDTDTLDYVTISDSTCQTLEDAGGTWTIDQVTQPPLSDKFHSNSTYNNGAGYSIHTYWMRCRLKNIMNKRADIFFYTPYADRIDYYFSRNDGRWDQESSGYLYAADNKTIFQANYYVPLSIDAGREITIYVRFYINYFYYANYSRPKNLELSYGSKEKFVNEYHKEYLLPAIKEAFLCGILIIALIYNLFFFWTVKERLYLYFSLFLLCFIISYCYAFLILTNFFHEYPRLFNYTSNIWAPLYLFFEVFFIRHFFKTWRHSPRWNNYLIGIAIFQLVTRFIAVFVGQVLPARSGDLIWQVDLISSYLVNLSIVITFFVFIRKRVPYTNLLLIAALPFALYLTIVRSATVAFDLFNIGYEVRFFKIILWLKKWNYIFYLISVFWLVLIFTLILFYRYKRLQKENVEHALERERLALEKETERSELIAKQKVELEQQVKERTSELKQSLEELKATQTQLIQSEKMASLGELTAGIAHEIQNPLNFVNNFSEVNNELIDELKNQKSKVKNERDEKLENELLDDIANNLEKINHHGKRAAAIVKGMLQHSRSSSGKKELTDINALADEYLRLSYHGLRARDKTFNAKFETDFDESIGLINVAPQDIGRVILNLINNAFYAVAEKKNTSTSSAGQEYEPTVTVTTKRSLSPGEDRGEVQIKVKDNGNGIPQKALDKIFQPFFTTKPTGQGTGLGLSLSYDIIKAHGGEIKVKTKEGEGSEFIIQLPAV
jgi:two-component system NtrC family sensor kinase